MKNAPDKITEPDSGSSKHGATNNALRVSLYCF